MAALEHWGQQSYSVWEEPCCCQSHIASQGDKEFLFSFHHQQLPSVSSFVLSASMTQSTDDPTLKST